MKKKPFAQPYRFLIVLAALALLWSAGFAAGGRPLEVVSSVDLMRYEGTWYEVARLPNRFQTKCAGEVKAEYSLQKDGRISVLNNCRQQDGSLTEARGVARRASKDKPLSRLKVRFAPAFLSFLPQVWGDYNIITLDSDYRWVVVGSEDRKYLWILSRTPRLDAAVYDRLVEGARQQDFDVAHLEKTRQQ